MSEIHTITPAKAPTSRVSKRQAAGIGTTLAFTLCLSAAPALADGELALQNVSVDANRQLVVKFSPGGAPKNPRITEFKTPTHLVYIDFADATLDERSVPAGDQLTKNLSAKMPGLRRAAVGIVTNAATPTVRLVLTLDPDLPIAPRVASVQEGAAVISMGGDYSGGRSANDGGVDEIKPFVMSDDNGEAESAPATASNDASAAYEEYYRKFLQQKQLNNTTVPAGDWGPRKGTVAEADSAKKKGMRIIGTPIDSPALADLPESVKEAASQPAKVRTAPKPKAPEPVAESAPEAAPSAEPEAVVETTPVRGHAPKPGAEVAEAPAQPEVQTEAPAEAAAPEAPAAEAPAVAAQPEATQPEAAAAEEPAAEAEVEPAKPAPVRHQVANPRVAPAGAAARPVRKVAQAPAPVAAATSEEEPAAPEAGEGEAPAAEAGEETNAMKAKKVFNSAVKNHMQGRVEQAVAQYKQALKLNPDLGCAHGNLGLAYNQMHNYENAISEFHKALAVNPRDAITYNGMGAALRAEKDMQGAIKNWQTAVKLDPKLAVAHFNLGTAYELENQPEQAMTSYQAAVGVDPRFGEAYYRMGLIMQKRHRFQDAKANFKKALTISADSDYAADAKLKIAAIEKISK